MAIVLWINHQPSGGREWVAEITGRDPKYGVARQFLRDIDRRWSGSGKTGRTAFALEAGRLYQIKPAWKDRYFACVRGGEVVGLGTSAVQEALDRLDRGEAAFPGAAEAAATEAAVAAGIARINGEGAIVPSEN